MNFTEVLLALWLSIFPWTTEDLPDLLSDACLKSFTSFRRSVIVSSILDIVLFLALL